MGDWLTLADAPTVGVVSSVPMRVTPDDPVGSPLAVGRTDAEGTPVSVDDELTVVDGVMVGDGVPLPVLDDVPVNDAVPVGEGVLDSVVLAVPVGVSVAVAEGVAAALVLGVTLDVEGGVALAVLLPVPLPVPLPVADGVELTVPLVDALIMLQSTERSTLLPESDASSSCCGAGPAPAGRTAMPRKALERASVVGPFK